MDWTFKLFFDSIMHHSVGLNPRQTGKEGTCDPDPEMGFTFRSGMFMTYMKV